MLFQSAFESAAFDHVAHAARRIRDLLPLYQDLLGGRFMHGAVNERLGYTTIQLGYPQGTKIELMEPTAGSGFLDGFFAKNPDGGVHHVTFRVPDMRAAVSRAERLGFEVFGVDTSRAVWQEAFLHPRSAHGLLIQIAQSPPGFPEVDESVSMGSLIAE